MALIEIFQGDPKTDKDRILNVLNQGLAAAEGKESALWSGSDDLRILFTSQGLERPKFLDRCSPEHQAIYNEWFAENRDRVRAVLNPNGTPGVPWEI